MAIKEDNYKPCFMIRTDGKYNLCAVRYVDEFSSVTEAKEFLKNFVVSRTANEYHLVDVSEEAPSMACWYVCFEEDDEAFYHLIDKY